MENNHVPAGNPALIALNTMRAAVSPEFLDELVVRLEGGIARFGQFLIHEDGVITVNGVRTTLTRAIVRLKLDQEDFESARPELLKNRKWENNALAFGGYRAVIQEDANGGFVPVVNLDGEFVALRHTKTEDFAQRMAKAWIHDALTK